MDNHSVPHGYWWPIGRVPSLCRSKMSPLRIFGQDYLLRQLHDGSYVVQKRFCPHLDADLAHGKILDSGELQCPYHGQRFGEDGHCQIIPQCPAAKVDERNTIKTGLSLEVRYGWIWISSGSPLAENAVIPDFSANGFAAPGWSNPVYGREIRRVNWRRCQENVLDFAHVDFVHPTFATPDDAVHQYKLERKDGVVSMRLDFNNPANSPVQKLLRSDGQKGIRSVDTLVQWFTYAPGVLQLTLSLPWTQIVTIVGLTPIEEDLTAINWFVIRNSPLRTQLLDPFYYLASKAVFAQDGAILDRLGRKFISDENQLNASDGPIKLARNVMRGIMRTDGAFKP